jgi:hypothetical protein
MNINVNIVERKLRYYLIEEIVSHGMGYFAGVSANPQDNIKLSKLGYPILNVYLLYLWSLGIVTYDLQGESEDFRDIKYYEWTNYRLTDEGNKLAKTEGV